MLEKVRGVDEGIEIRARPITLIVMILNAGFWSIVLIGSASALMFGRDHATLTWILIAFGSALGFAIALRLQARFDNTGISVQNAFRSRKFVWQEITQIRVIPSVWYCCEPGWAAAMLEVTTARGERFPIRVATHLSRTPERLTSFLTARSAEHGFDVPETLIRLWRRDARVDPPSERQLLP